MCAAAALFAFAGPARAAYVIKQDTTNMVANTTDWSVAPGTNDIGEFNATISSGNESFLTLGGDLSIGGLQFDGSLNGPVIIGDDGNSLLLNNTGTDIDASQANQNITINCAVALGASQTWNVTNTQTLSVGGAIRDGGSDFSLTMTGAGTLSLAGTNTYSGATTISNGVLQIGATGSISNSPVIFVGTNGAFDVSSRAGTFTLANLQTLEGYGVVTGAVTAAAGSQIIPGTIGSVGVLTFTNDLTESA